MLYAGITQPCLFVQMQRHGPWSFIVLRAGEPERTRMLSHDLDLHMHPLLLAHRLLSTYHHHHHHPVPVRVGVPIAIQSLVLSSTTSRTRTMASDSHSSAQRSATETAVPNSPDLSGEAAKGASPSSPSSPNSRLIIASGSDNPPPIASSSDPKGKRKADTQTAIRQVATDVWTFSRPFARFGLIPVGGRSTAVRLNDGGVWVLASTPLDERTRERLQAMGEVK